MILYLSMSTLPLSEIWHDPLILTILTIAATLFAGIIGAIVAYWIFRRQRSKKEIAYQVISDAPVININKAVEDRVKITLDDDPVTTEVRLTVLKIWNSGNAAIRRDDYDEPLVIRVDERTVVSWDVLETTPADLKTYLKQLLQSPKTPSPSPTPQEQQTISAPTQPETTPRLNPAPNFIELPKFLLNKGQSTTLTILLKGIKSKISMTGRIVDGEIQEFNPDIQPANISILPIVAFLATIIFFTIFLTSLSPAKQTQTSSSINGFEAVLTFIGLIVGVLGGLLTIITYLARDVPFSRIRKYGIRFRW